MLEQDSCRARQCPVDSIRGALWSRHWARARVQDVQVRRALVSGRIGAMQEIHLASKRGQGVVAIDLQPKPHQADHLREATWAAFQNFGYDLHPMSPASTAFNASGAE